MRAHIFRRVCIKFNRSILILYTFVPSGNRLQLMPSVPTNLSRIETRRNLDWLSRHPFKISNVCRKPRVCNKNSFPPVSEKPGLPANPQGSSNNVPHRYRKIKRDPGPGYQFFNIDRGQILSRFTRRKYFSTLFRRSSTRN